MPPPPLTADLLIRAYAAGAFPMARGRDTATVDWYSPDPRALLPLDDRFTVRRSLRQQLRRRPFDIRRDTAFEQVLDHCAAPRPGADDTWINPALRAAVLDLHRANLTHSVEAWQEGQLVGGLYGVALGAAFFGESMFSLRSGASQVCLVHLVDHLRARGFELLDVQFVNPHLEQFGVYEIPRDRYLRSLATALTRPVTW